MKLVYLVSNGDIFHKAHTGIYRKIRMQAGAFEKLGYDTTLIFFDDMRCYKYELSTGITELAYCANIMKSSVCVFDWLAKINPEYIYIRYRFMENYGVFDFYQKLTSQYANVVCEMPTFPYDDELVDGSLLKENDRLFRPYLKECFKSMVTYNKVDEIYGIPVKAVLVNGVDVEKIPVKKVRKKDGVIKLVGLATMQFWHGYDRVIEGLREYYSDNPTVRVELYLVGEGPESSEYSELVEKYNLQEYIHQIGMVTDKERLNEIFDEMDIAIGSVGIHRLKLESVSPIKAAEYCARGIPFVIDYNDVAIQEGYPYVLKVPENDDYIDINSIVQFYERMDLTKAACEMRKYAEENLTWKKQLKKVIEMCK